MVTPNLPCHKGSCTVFSVVGRQVIVSHRRPSWLKKRLRPRSFRRSRTSLRSVAPCHFRIRCFRVCVVGGRRSSFPKPALLHTTGSNPSGVPRRVPSRTRVLHTIGYLSSTLPLNRLWWLFTDIPEPLSLSLFQAISWEVERDGTGRNKL